MSRVWRGPIVSAVAFILIPLMGSPDFSAHSSPFQLAEATNAFYSGDFAKTLELTQAYLKSNPKSTKGRILLARVSMVQGQYPQAISQLRRAWEISPEDVDVLYYLAQVAGNLYRMESQQLFSQAPDSGRAHQLLGEIYQSQEDSDKAMEEYQSAVKANPKLFEAWMNMGILARAGHSYEEAATYYTKALEIEPADYEALLGLGLCYQSSQEFEKALEVLAQAIRIEPAKTDPRLAMADAQLNLGKATDALQQIEFVIKLDARSRQAYILRGRAYQALGNEQLAAESFKKAQELVRLELDSRRSKLRHGIGADTEPPASKANGHQVPKQER